MRCGALVGAVACAAAIGAPTRAHADSTKDGSCELYDRLWPSAPIANRLTLSQEIQDAITELGRTVNQHVGSLSDGRFGLTFDGRRRRAFVRIDATADERYLVFARSGDVHFVEGVARIQARVQLGVAGHVVALELPDVEMAPAELRGDRGVEIRLPLFKRAF